jgi:hypothetical protein
MGAISLLARLADVSSQTYRNWQGEDLVRGPRSDEGTELDVLEAVTVGFLLKELGDQDGRIAWAQIRDPYLSSIPTETLRLAYWLQRFEARLCVDDGDVGRAVSDGQPVKVVHLGRATLEGLESFRRRARSLGRPKARSAGGGAKSRAAADK